MFLCAACDKVCSSCAGSGPDKCKACASGYQDTEGTCTGTAEVIPYRGCLHVTKLKWAQWGNADILTLYIRRHSLPLFSMNKLISYKEGVHRECMQMVMWKEMQVVQHAVTLIKAIIRRVMVFKRIKSTLTLIPLYWFVYPCCVFQISMSVLSQSQFAQRSTRSVSIIKAATCASALVAMRRKMASVSKHHRKVRIALKFWARTEGNFVM